MGAVSARDTAKDADTVSVCGEGLPVYQTKAACEVALAQASVQNDRTIPTKVGTYTSR